MSENEEKKSGFDLFLQRSEIISKILLAGVATVLIAVWGKGLDWQQFQFNKNKVCLEKEEEIRKSISKTGETTPPNYAHELAKACGIPIEKASADIKNKKTIQQLDQQISSTKQTASSPSKTEFKGFVAIGKKDAKSYSQINFNLAQTDKSAFFDDNAPQVGATLKARWSVNLRGNTKITTGKENPIVKVILENECVKIISKPKEVRSQFWAEVKTTKCE